MADKESNGAEWPRSSGFPSVDKKRRIIWPSAERKNFLKKNKISLDEPPKNLLLVVNDTADGIWGMTDEMFEPLATAIRRENRDFIKFLYRNPLSMSFEDSQKRFGPLTQMEELGLVNFGDNERFHVVCSQHEDYLGVGYFFRFTPARLTASGQIEYPNFRNRVAKILGADFLDFLSKMPR